jgi:hypothetical protein
LIAAALVSACSDRHAATSRHVPSGLPTETTLLRLSRGGGVATLLHPDSLTPVEWRTSGLPPISRVLGTDREEKMAYAVDSIGRLVGIDLRAQRWRPYLQAAHLLTGTADGVILGLDSSRHPLRLASRALTTYRGQVDRGPVQLLGAPGTQIVAVSASAGVAQVLDEDGEARRVKLPSGDVSGTWAGDLFAVTTDSGVVLGEPARKGDAVDFIPIRGNPTVSAFSPSGHRLYVARDKADLVMFDRFSHDDLRTLSLPGVAAAIRVDRTGRWLLARPLAGDSVWIVDLIRWEVASTILTRWADDLPVVASGRTLIARDGKDVIAIDLTAAKPMERSRLVGAAGDVFLAVPWTPEGRVPDAAIASAPTAPPSDTAETPADDSLAIAPAPEKASPATKPTPAPAPGAAASAAVYLQVASSQNVDWANAFAQQLKEGGFPARRLNPKAAGEPFRVVIGPYATRDEADAVGRRLGRPYFLLSPGATEP